jgi:predicted transcriptional regulator
MGGGAPVEIEQRRFTKLELHRISGREAAVKKIKDLSTNGAITIDRSESLMRAAKLLADDDIGSLIVFDVSGCVGIFSERDLARAVADEVDLDDTSVEDYMTESPVEVEREAGVGDAIGKMNEYGVRHLVVTDHGHDIVGVISMRDIFQLLGTTWPEL